VNSQALESAADRFLQAILDRNRDVALQMLQKQPDLARFSVHAAAAAGDVDAVAAFLGADPASAVTPYGKIQAPPLVFAAGSPLHDGSPTSASALLDVAQRLIAAGASPNSFSLFFGDGDKGEPISALYFAIMSNHLGMVRLLLSRGARTQDGESIYHAAQHNRRECLELLAQFGADFSARQSPYGNTPLYFLAGHHGDDDGRAAWAQGTRWLLEHGADPNVVSNDHASTPLHMLATGGRQRVLEWIVEFGGDVNAKRKDGRTPYAIAWRTGNVQGAEFLRNHGALTTDLSPLDQFLGACHAGRLAEARAVVAAHPALVSSLSAADKGALSDAVRHDNLEAIQTLLTFGFDLAWEESEGGTPLHTAAWLGKVKMVDALLAMGAPVNQREHRFGSSPLGWTAHGSGFGATNGIPRIGMGTDDDYCAIVDRLADAGATREASINKWGEAPEGMASERVIEKLIDRGLAPRRSGAE